MNLLVSLLLIPLAGAVVCALGHSRHAKGFAFFFSLLTLAAGVLLALDASGSCSLGNGFATGADYNAGSLPIGFSFHLGADGISIMLILLTVGLTPLAMASSFQSIREREREYYGWMLALLSAMIGVFLAKDLLLFYVFFELTLIPMFFIIGIWGGPDRRYAAAKFFLFTFAGSIFLLVATIYVGLKAHTFDIDGIARFAQLHLTADERFWVVLGIFAGLAVKVPLFPVHTWLPLAHTEAPTAGSVILAGVLLKLGTYGIIRLAVPIGLVGVTTESALGHVIWWIGVLCLIGIVYGALAAWVQKDIKKLVAYSSVSHLGFCVLGLVALNAIGMQGSVLYMINHGISTGAMFLVIGMIYDRYHTRDINALSGLARKMPIMAFFFVFFVLSSIGLPLTNGFVSEFFTILGAFTSQFLGVRFAAIAALGIILGAVYMLHMTARVIFGPLKVPDLHADGHSAHSDEKHKDPGDLNAREIAILVPLAIAVLVFGLQSSLITGPIRQPIEKIRNAVSVEASSEPATEPASQPAVTAADRTTGAVSRTDLGN